MSLSTALTWIDELVLPNDALITYSPAISATNLPLSEISPEAVVLLLVETPEKENFGKQIAGDILEGKKTILSIKAIEKIPSNRKKEFVDLLNTNKIDDFEKVQLVIDVYNELEVLSDANNLKNRYYKLALDNLSNLELSADKTNKLISFAQFLMNRNY